MAKKNDTTFFENKLLDFVTWKLKLLTGSESKLRTKFDTI